METNSIQTSELSSTLAVQSKEKLINLLSLCHIQRSEQYQQERQDAAAIATTASKGKIRIEPKEEGRFSGFLVARLFAEEASRKLSHSEFPQLLKFFEDYSLRTTCHSTRDTFEEALDKRLQTFYTDETTASNKSRNGLCRPGGPPDADICLILHIQSEEECIAQKNWWNPYSPTINILTQKGFSGEFTFAFDWHWRATVPFSPGTATQCPARQWNSKIKKIHDSLSIDILELLPLPFVVVLSGCVRENIKRSLGRKAKMLEIKLNENSHYLQFHIDFQENSIRRLFLYLHHPAAGFLQGLNERHKTARQIDAGLNFCLWLSRRFHEENTLEIQYRSTGFCIRGKAPFKEMYRYHAQEISERRHLSLEEYSAPFIGWAQRYLQKDPKEIVAQGDSLVGEAKFLNGKIISIKSGKTTTIEEVYYPRSRKINGIVTKQTLHGRLVEVYPCGTVRLPRELEEPSMYFIGAVDAKKLIGLDGEVRIFVSRQDQEIQLRMGDEIVHRKGFERLFASCLSDVWVKKIRYELGWSVDHGTRPAYKRKKYQSEA